MIGLLARRWLQRPGHLLSRSMLGIAIGGVAIAVAGLVLTQGVMHGFQTQLAEKFRGVQPHLRIDAPEWTPAMDAQVRAVVATTPDVRAYPVSEGDVVLQVPGDEGASDLVARLWGVEPAMLTEATRTRWSLFASTHADTTAADDIVSRMTALQQATGLPGLIVGRGVMGTLAVMGPDGMVRVTAPVGLLDPAGELRPLVRNATIEGLFTTGLVSEDDQRVYTTRTAAEQLLGVQARTAWLLYAPSDAVGEQVATALRAALHDTSAHVVTWREANQKLFSALQLEARVMQAVLACMLLLTSCSVIGVIATVVWSKQRHIALLVACGATVSDIRRIVVAMGAWIGGVGAGVGAVLAIGVASWLRSHPIALPDAFYLPELPVQIRAVHLIMACVGTTVVAMLCASYPARWAARLDIIEGLRAE